MPVVVGREGIVRWMQPELNEEETRAFAHSADVVRAAIVGTLGERA